MKIRVNESGWKKIWFREINKRLCRMKWPEQRQKGRREHIAPDCFSFSALYWLLSSFVVLHSRRRSMRRRYRATHPNNILCIVHDTLIGVGDSELGNYGLIEQIHRFVEESGQSELRFRVIGQHHYTLYGVFSFKLPTISAQILSKSPRKPL